MAMFKSYTLNSQRAWFKFMGQQQSLGEMLGVDEKEKSPLRTGSVDSSTIFVGSTNAKGKEDVWHESGPIINLIVSRCAIDYKTKLFLVWP